MMPIFRFKNMEFSRAFADEGTITIILLPLPTFLFYQEEMRADFIHMYISGGEL